MMSYHQCPLCLTNNTQFYHEDNNREYYQCDECQLVFVPSNQLLSSEEEKTHYDLHQNNPGDPGYRLFLNRLFSPMVALLRRNAQGLDYGSGPGPTLSVMFEEQGYDMEIYDYFYANDELVFNKRYDFITCTETIEHIQHPHEDINRLWSLLKENGYLGIMTKLVENKNRFSDWHYKNDPTHICFYSRATFDWLATKLGASVNYHSADVIIFKKHKESHIE